MLRFLRNTFLLFTLSASSAFAVGDTFEQGRFVQLLKDGKPVLVAVHADWCSTCLTQEKLLKNLLQTAPYNRLQVLRVDFDRQPDVLRALGVQWQSTLIVYRNGREMDRSTADSDKDSLARLLRKAL